MLNKRHRNLSILYYKLYVDGKEVSINSGSYDSSNVISNTIDTTTTIDDNTNTQNNNIYYVIGGIVLLVVIGITSVIIIKKNKWQIKINLKNYKI